MTKILIAGVAGRMGRRILNLTVNDAELVPAGGFEYEGHDAVGKELGSLIGTKTEGVNVAASFSDVAADGDVLIDFTAPEVTMKNLEVAVREGTKMVIGTTGLNKEQEAKIKEASKKTAIVFAPNMSVGVNLLFKVIKQVASVLNDDYDIEIVEAHHKYKKDSPSGTALGLAKAAAEGRGIDLDEKAVYGREGLCGERERGTIGMHAVRGGDVVGDHTVSFMTEGERIEIGHRASSRDAFAKGSLVAAKFLMSQEKGLFNMQDVLGI